MSETPSDVKNTITYLFPVVLGNAIPLLTLPILTRLLSREDYGMLALAQVYATFVTGLANFGLIFGYERNFFQYREAAAAGLLYATLAFVLATTLGVLGLTWFFQAPLARLVIGSADQGALLFWVTAATALLSLKAYYLVYFKNVGNARAYGWATADENVASAVLSVVFVVYLHLGVMGLVWGPLLSAAIVLLVLVPRFLLKVRPALNGEGLLDSLRLSLPLTPRIFLGIVGNQADKYLIGLLVSVGGVGVYSIGQKIAYTGFHYMTALQNVYAPRVFQQMFALAGEGGRAIGRYLTGFAYASMAFPLLLVLGAEEIMAVLTPAPYHGGAAVIIILSAYYAFLFFGKVNGAQLIYARKTHITSLLTVIGLILSVGASILFIRRWGAIGAAWATLAAGSLSTVIGFLASQHYYRINWEYRKLLPMLAVLGGAALLLMGLRAMDVPYAVRMVVKLFAAGLYVLVGVRSGILSWAALLRAVRLPSGDQGHRAG